MATGGAAVRVRAKAPPGGTAGPAPASAVGTAAASERVRCRRGGQPTGERRRKWGDGMHGEGREEGEVRGQLRGRGEKRLQAGGAGG